MFRSASIPLFVLLEYVGCAGRTSFLSLTHTAIFFHTARHARKLPSDLDNYAAKDHLLFSHISDFHVLRYFFRAKGDTHVQNTTVLMILKHDRYILITSIITLSSIVMRCECIRCSITCNLAIIYCNDCALGEDFIISGISNFRPIG